jgi:methylglutaconyl-CoA hydratase
MNFTHLIVTRDGPVEHVVLNRPAVRNAFNAVLVEDLHHWAASVGSATDARVAVLSGAGTVFCAGGDLETMARVAQASPAENERDAARLAAMLDALDRLPIPLIGRIHGAAVGGGVGLAAVCDIVVADEAAVFGFTEVKLGLVPAVISPYALAKIGWSAARELFLTGARFGAARAREVGLVHTVAAAGEIDAAVARHVAEILTAGPEAVREAKTLLRRIRGRDAADVSAITAGALAARRASAEGQEGMRAFLGRRPAGWVAR